MFLSLKVSLKILNSGIILKTFTHMYRVCHENTYQQALQLGQGLRPGKTPCADPEGEGGTGGADPPPPAKKSQKYRVY